MTIPAPRDPKPVAARIRAKNQITIPQAVCDATRIAEGEFVTLTVVKKRTVAPPGSIIMQPQQLSSRPWTAEDWERAEDEVDAEVKAGKLSRHYKGAKAVIRALRRKP